MAIRLTFDVIGSTCGDLLRFADAVRAAGAQPEQPLEQSSGPNRIDVVVDDGRVTRPYPPGPAPMSRPHRPPPMPPHMPPSMHQPGVPGFVMSGSFPPEFGYRPGSRWEERQGGFIGVSWGNRSRHTDFTLDTANRWKTALDAVLGSADVDESVKASLRDLREAFSDQDTPPGYGS
jgi:hypothetical protein